MVKALVFKGDKKPHKKRKHATSALSGVESSIPPTSTSPSTDQQLISRSQGRTELSSADAIAPEDDDSWTTALSPADLAGPVVLAFSPADQKLETVGSGVAADRDLEAKHLDDDTPLENDAVCLACDAQGSVFASPLENTGAPPGEGGSEPAAAQAEPHDVRQVWEARRIAGVGDDVVSLKGHHGRYLTSDSAGLLFATREAISAEEQFTIVPIPDRSAAFALQTSRGTYVACSPSSTESLSKRNGGAGAASLPSRAGARLPTLRGDASALSTEGPTTVYLRVQRRFVPRLQQRVKEHKATQRPKRAEMERDVGRSLTDEELRRLKRARKEGSYREAVLDARVGGKHDKYA